MRRVVRPWGWFEVIYQYDDVTIKRIRVNPFSSLSYQTHEHRSESWTFTHVPTGLCAVKIDGTVHSVRHGSQFFVPAGIKHRIMNKSNVAVELVEVAIGDFSEDDIVRLDDDFGRV